MRALLVCMVYAAATSTTALAQTPDVSPPTPVASQVKMFVIEPDKSNEVFMCASGRIQSVLAFATAEHRVVSVIFLDMSGSPIPANVWSEAFGFRLFHTQTVRIEATMICGS